MADRGPFSNRDMPRQNNGYGNNGYGNNAGYGNTTGYASNPGYGNSGGYGNTGYGNTTGYGSGGHGNSGYGNYGNNDSFDRRGSVDVRKPQQQNAYRMRNNRGSNTWQRGPVAPSMSWRDQGRPAEMGSRNSYHTPGGKALHELLVNTPCISVSGMTHSP